MISEMVRAHLQNVESLIEDLIKQKNNIEQEITKLYSYIKKGTEELNNFENSASKPEVDNDSKVVNQHYLGE